MSPLFPPGNLRLRGARGEPSPEETAVPLGFRSDAERERLDSFPTQITRGDIVTDFTLSRADRRQVPRTASAANRRGFALQLGAVRYLGFSPDDLSTVPEAVVAFVAKQLDVAPTELHRYGRRGQTRTEHLRQIREDLAFRKATARDLPQLESWFVGRALEDDRPTLLLRLAAHGTVRPGAGAVREDSPGAGEGDPLGARGPDHDRLDHGGGHGLLGDPLDEEAGRDTAARIALLDEVLHRSHRPDAERLCEIIADQLPVVVVVAG